MTVARSCADLADRVVVVTGSGRPAGRSAALAAASAGARVCCVDADSDELDVTVKAVATAGGAAHAFHSDLDSRGAADDLVAEVLDRENRLDVLCNFRQDPGDGLAVEDLTPDRFDQMFRANFKSTLFASQAAGRAMVEAGAGSIINLAPGILDVAVGGTASCAVSASAVAFMTKVMAKEVGSSNVRVNTIAAAPSLGLHVFPQQDPRHDRLYPATARPVLERHGTLEDLGSLTVFLASDASAYITGQTIRLSGGWVMPW